MSIKIRYFISTLIITAGTVVMYKTQSIEYGFYVCLLVVFFVFTKKDWKKSFNEPINFNVKELLPELLFLLVAFLIMNIVEKNERNLVTKWYFAVLFWIYWAFTLIMSYRRKVEEKEKLKNTEKNGIGKDIDGE